jgi:hypothetical protein
MALCQDGPGTAIQVELLLQAGVRSARRQRPAPRCGPGLPNPRKIPRARCTVQDYVKTISLSLS